MEGFVIKENSYFIKNNGNFYKVWKSKNSKEYEAFKIDESEFDNMRERANEELGSEDEFPDFVIESIKEKYKYTSDLD